MATLPTQDLYKTKAQYLHGESYWLHKLTEFPAKVLKTGNPAIAPKVRMTSLQSECLVLQPIRESVDSLCRDGTALGIWLNTDVYASWSDVVTAVSSSIVGDKRLAADIQLKYLY